MEADLRTVDYSPLLLFIPRVNQPPAPLTPPPEIRSGLGGCGGLDEQRDSVFFQRSDAVGPKRGSLKPSHSCLCVLSLVSGVLGTSELKLSVAVTVRTCEAKSGISRQLVLHAPRASMSGRSYFQWAVCGGGGFGCLMHCRFSLPAGRG
ncbi:hypothetical protein SRHO_G00167710 [Serrasalmus rhombeus]